ncbi:MAG: NlpC/P60 family protein [Candidatus Coproplasma sp.]
MKRKIILVYAAFITMTSCVAAFGCSAPKDNGAQTPESGIVEELPPASSPDAEENPPTQGETPEADGTTPPNSAPPAEEVNPPAQVETPVETPKPAKAEYIKINADSVNIRSGAGTNYSVLGVAEKNSVYIYEGRSGSWIKTSYKHKTAYISANYCTLTYMDASENKKVEAVISEGAKCLGVPYVYGATRYLDENGKRISSFNKNQFDCSSLMQYIFKLGADVNLKLNTRTQIYQGTTVKKSEIRRGDLLFFTNDARKNNVGIERVGHVALYLGDNYILHTSSDYARIEQISTKRWGYYIQAQRIL